MGKLICMEVTIGYLQSLGHDITPLISSGNVKTLEKQNYLLIKEEEIQIEE